MQPATVRRIRLFASAVLVGSLSCACAALRPPDAADARINAQVKALFADNGGLQTPNEVDVQTRHGVVYLHGLVDTPFEQALAGSLALKVAGVSRVENLVAVSNSR